MVMVMVLCQSLSPIAITEGGGKDGPKKNHSGGHSDNEEGGKEDHHAYGL